jgi:SpoVK/Ycf46/Vps4 family AAA+-type ATPase
MIGLQEIKEHITRVKNFVLFKKKVKDIPDIECPDISLHAMFVGPPGSGKTSVGLLYASILKEAGILSKGNLLLANGRNAFMGKYVGSEEKNVRMALAAAKGNVLLVDEAYTLVNANEMDYARNVLPMMLQLLSDEEYRDIAVILCGYDAEMDFLLSSNPGLRSRFPNIFHFEDYSLDELQKIAVKKIQQSGYILTDEANRKISQVLQEMYESRVKTQWANGREASNLFDRILVAHANRCISSGAEGDMLITITVEDIPEAEKKPVKKSRKIGFH